MSSRDVRMTRNFAGRNDAARLPAPNAAAAMPRQESRDLLSNTVSIPLY